MAAIVINISNSKKVGLTDVRRKITINGHIKDYVESVYTIPYLLEHFNANDEKIITGRKKRQLAKHVGEHITQGQFENDLTICFTALQRCWELAY